MCLTIEIKTKFTLIKEISLLKDMMFKKYIICFFFKFS